MTRYTLTELRCSPADDGDYVRWDDVRELVNKLNDAGETIANMTDLDIHDRIAIADKRYGPVANIHETIGALHLELYEVHEAHQTRRNARVADELMDVAVVAIRGAMALTRRGD